MAANQSAVGQRYRLAEPFQVGREQLRQFARAVGVNHPACFDLTAAQALGYDDLTASPTFAAVVAQRAEALYIQDPASGIDLTRLVHAEEAIRHHRPICAGDHLSVSLTVQDIRRRGDITMITTVAELSDAAEQPVATVTSRLAVRDDAG
jgi:acyl dehydratase